MSSIGALLDVLPSQLSNERDALGFARDIGEALPTLSSPSLHKLRNALVHHAANYEAPRLAIATMVELVDGYAYGSGRAQPIVLRGMQKKLVKLLEGGPRTPTELAAALGTQAPAITRIVKRLRELGLIAPAAREVVDQRRIEVRLSALSRRALRTLSSFERKQDTWRLSLLEVEATPSDDENDIGDSSLPDMFRVVDNEVTFEMTSTPAPLANEIPRAQGSNTGPLPQPPRVESSRRPASVPPPVPAVGARKRHTSVPPLPTFAKKEE
ncbi:MAG: MarR family winged helix-turn-helix transcriptional regulator [Kofleriaceae bacterium]